MHPAAVVAIGVAALAAIPLFIHMLNVVDAAKWERSNKMDAEYKKQLAVIRHNRMWHRTTAISGYKPTEMV